MLKTGKRVVKQEQRALEQLHHSMDHQFTRAVQLIMEHSAQYAASKLILSGMGKSGHIASKLAATFASTGQPSFFVHPAESGHGDLGMIGPHDMLLLLSYSGETRELQPLCDYAKRRSLPLITITGDKESTLANLATVALVLPQVPEACPMGLAPTASSTMSLALGDALAISLLSARGFTREDFHIFHPSGSLAKQLRRVEDVMHTQIPLVMGDTPIKQAIDVMTQYGFGCVGITDAMHGALQGIMTDGDIRRHALKGQFAYKLAQDVMTRNPATVGPKALVMEAIALLEQRSISALFIIDAENRPLGVVRLLDCVRA